MIWYLVTMGVVVGFLWRQTFSHQEADRVSIAFGLITTVLLVAATYLCAAQ